MSVINGNCQTHAITETDYDEDDRLVHYACAGLVDGVGYKVKPAKDNLPYLTLGYANGPSAAGSITNRGRRTDLTGVDTGKRFTTRSIKVKDDLIWL